MKLYTLLIALLLCGGAMFAQVPDSSIGSLMNNRMYDCYEVEYNSVLQAQRLYERHQWDTLDALVGFWKTHCGVSTRLFSLDILNSIRNRTFKEHISQNEFLARRVKASYSDNDLYESGILYYLKYYKSATRGEFSDAQYDRWLDGNYALPKDYTDYAKLYKSYYAFLQHMAGAILKSGKHTPLEEYLLRFYADPDSTRYEELDSAIYSGTVLQSAYLGAKKYHNDIHGFGHSLHLGYWTPNGALSVLGSHPYLAYQIGGRSENIMMDYIIGVRFGGSPNTYNVVKDDSLYLSSHYLSWYTGLDFGAKLYRTRRSELDALWGVGYEEIQVLSIAADDSKNSENKDGIYHSVKSFYANAGLGYRFYITDRVHEGKHRRSYVSLQAKYNYTDYRNNGGTDLSGGAFTIGVAYGGYSHSYTNYPHLE